MRLQTGPDHRARRADRRATSRSPRRTCTGARSARCRPGRGRPCSARSCFAMTGFGLGWVNAGGDYSRYLPRVGVRRAASSAGRRSAAASRPSCSCSGACCSPARTRTSTRSIAADPIGALTTLLPTWFLVPFALVAIGGLVGGAVLDIYSSGLTLLTLGVADPPLRRPPAIDGVLMILGTIYVVWFAGRLPRPVPGLPDHPRRPDGRLVRHLPGRPRAASRPVRRGGALRRPGSLRRGQRRRRRHVVVATVDRLGPGDQHVRRRGCRGRATCSGRSASAARRAPGRTRTSACSSRS